MVKKVLVIIILIMIIRIPVINAQEKVKWYTFEEAIEMNKTNPRKIIIDVYTNWCHWCKVMDKETFSNPIIADYLNKNYYPVKLNAEGHDTITFQEHVFVNEGGSKRGSHQLAIALLQGKMSYPSIAYMDENNKLITAVPGYWDAKKIEPLLEYIKDGLYAKNIAFDEFQKTFKGKIK